MSPPELYRDYERDEAVRLFGSPSSARFLEDGDWVIFPNAALCFTVLTRSPRSSEFPGATRFQWVAQRPSRSAPDRYSGVPLEIRAGTKHELHLFARGETDLKFVYLGRLNAAHSFGISGHGSWGEADLDLQHSIPTGVWYRLTGEPRPANTAELDDLLTRLNPQTSSEDKLSDPK